MKTLNFLTFLFIAAVSFNCNTDDAPSTPQYPETTINLEFDFRTNQDQMGNFSSNAMAIFNSYVWSFGGTNSYTSGGDSSGILWNSPNGENWSNVNTNNSLPTLGRHGLTLTAFNNTLFLIGGKDNDNNNLSDIWITTNGTDWSELYASAPFGEVSGHATIVYNGRMYVICINADTLNTKIWSTANGTSWTENNSNTFPALKRYKAVVFNNAMYVIGSEKVTGELSNEIWRSTDGTTWTLVTQHATNNLPAIKRHTATVYNNKVFVIGGTTSTSSYTNNIYYSTDMENWYLYTDSNPLEAINDHCSLNYNNDLWVFGGYRGSPNASTGKIWRIIES